jgi:hypothetical protein
MHPETNFGVSPMNARKYCSAIVGSCLAVFAGGGLAQAPSASTAAPATSAAGTATGSSETNDQQGAPAVAPAKKMHGARKHGAMHSDAMHSSRMVPPVNSDEAQYRTALRQCVAGQASQRDQCLDDAIARYGRS